MGAEAGAPFPIFLYHRIDPGRRTDDPFALAEDTFRHQMTLLARSGRRTHTISELVVRRTEPGPPLAAVTFDDGTADFHERAWPILRDLGLAVTLYVTTGLVGERSGPHPMLTWEQLAELDAAGVEVAAHGHHHVQLDAIPLARATVECVNSKLLLEGHLDHPVTSFAYPFGYHSEALKRILPRAGYASACAVKNRLSHPRDDPFALARLTITRKTSTRQFERLMSGHGAARAREGERVRTRAWRAYRRGRTRIARRER